MFPWYTLGSASSFVAWLASYQYVLPGTSSRVSQDLLVVYHRRRALPLLNRLAWIPEDLRYVHPGAQWPLLLLPRLELQSVRRLPRGNCKFFKSLTKILCRRISTRILRLMPLSSYTGNSFSDDFYRFPTSMASWASLVSTSHSRRRECTILPTPWD